MKVTKSQKIFAGILGVGVSALVLDRYFEGTGSVPTVATGLITSAASAQNESAAGTQPSSLTSIANDLDMCGRLNALEATESHNPAIRDAFAIPLSFGIGDGNLTTTSERATKFRADHRLKAVIDRNGEGQAIVNNSLVTAGQFVDGFRLESVTHMRATFVSGDLRVELRIEEADGSESQVLQPQ